MPVFFLFLFLCSWPDDDDDDEEKGEKKSFCT